MLRAIAKALFASRAWILSIAFLAAVGVVVGSSQPFQACVKEIYYDPATENFEKSISSVSVSVAFEVYRVCLGNFTHDNAEAIIAAFTVLLALSTIFLWVATRDLVSGTGKTAKAQLRAYIFSDHAKIISFTTTPHPLVNVSFKNSGQTPAYDVNVWMSCHIGVYPLQKKRERQTDESGASSGHIGPGASFQIPVQLSENMTASHAAAIRSGVEAIYAYGEVNYIDAFDKARFTKFCFFYGGKAGCPPQGVMATYSNWNEAN